MKILVVGRGWTGNKVFSELVKRGHQVTFDSHYNVLNTLIENKSLPKFDWVVNCAGVTGSPNVDACENERTKTLEGNSIFPIQLYDRCSKMGIKLAHFSSGCIYTGEINSIDANPNFFGSIYSISKGVSDVFLKNKALVFRIRMPFTGKKEPKNYLTKVLKYAKTGKLIDSGYNSLTDHDEAVSVACDLIEEDKFGPYNLVNSGSIAMKELADMLGVHPEWFTSEEFKNATAAARSTCVIPDCDRMRPVTDALKSAIEKLNNE